MKLYEFNPEIERLTEEAIDPETGEINEELWAKIDELNLAKQEKAESMALFVKNLRSDAAQLKAEKQALADRQTRKERLAETLTMYLARCLDGEKLSTPRVEVGYRRSYAVECYDMEQVPEEYLRTKVEVEVDKTKAKEFIKQGGEIPGLVVVAKQNVQIK